MGRIKPSPIQKPLRKKKRTTFVKSKLINPIQLYTPKTYRNRNQTFWPLNQPNQEMSERNNSQVLQQGKLEWAHQGGHGELHWHTRSHLSTTHRQESTPHLCSKNPSSRTTRRSWAYLGILYSRWERRR